MDWHSFYLQMCYQVAQKSKDPSTKVGCVITGPNNEVRSIGFNGFPRQVKDTINTRYNRPTKYFLTEHAERNAIYNACRIATSLDGCRLYVPWMPCHDCARGIIQVGIKEIILDKNFDDSDLKSRWKKSWNFAKIMLTEAEVLIEYHNTRS